MKGLQNFQTKFNNPTKTWKETDKSSISLTIYLGDFNAKIAKRNNSENCTESWLRGTRNSKGLLLIECCEKNYKLIAKSCFKYSAQYIILLSQKSNEQTAKKITNIYIYIYIFIYIYIYIYTLIVYV